MNGVTAVGAMLITIGLSGLARLGLPQGGNGGAIPAIAAGTCGLVLALLACAGRALSWPGAVLLACASVCAATDVQTGFIFDRVLLASAIAIVVATWNAGRLADGAIAAVACAGGLAIPFGISRGRALGLGDVKFAGTAALALGLHAALGALWLACVSGGGVAAAALVTRQARRNSRLPFGAFLALGACVALFVGDPR